MASNSEKSQLSVTTLLAYAGPAIPLAMLNVPFHALLAPYYAKEVGIGLAELGAIFFGARLWDGLSDPLVGSLSDKTRSRFGRRKIWMLAAVVPLMLFTWLICRPPENVGVTYLGFCLFFVYLSWTMLNIPFLSWGAELSPYYNERSKITGYREGAAMIGILLSCILPILLMQSDGTDMREALDLFLMAFIVLMPTTLFFCLRKVPESEHTTNIAKFSLKETIRGIIINIPFLRFLLALFSFRLAWSIFDACIIFLFAAYFAGYGFPGGFFLLILVLYITSASCAPLAVKAARIFGKHKALSYGLILSALFFISVPYVAKLDSPLAVLAIFFIMGVGNSTLWVVPTSIIADAVDYGAFKGSSDESGIYMAAYNIVLKITQALSIGIAYPLLQFFGFNPAEDAQNSAEALVALNNISSYLPALVIIPAILLLWKYPITEARQNQIRRILEKRKNRIIPSEDEYKTVAADAIEAS